ncbi:MAG: GNAT family N-acetyltransferase [Betaproteobacteria bacterium]
MSKKSTKLRDTALLRSASDADAALVGELINACTTAYQGVARSSTQDALARLHFGGSDPARDAFVVIDGERTVGFAHLWRFGPDEVRCFARAHPDARGAGIGDALVTRCRQRAAEVFAENPASGEATMTATAWARDATGPALLRAHGFTPVRHFLSMAIGTDEIRDPVVWPTGVESRVFRSGDEAPLFDAFSDAFAEQWGAAQDSSSWWRERRDSKADFDPSLWLVAVADEIVGFALCEIRRDGVRTLGRVAEIGVRRRCRGEGIGYALLVDAFSMLRGRGATEITLDVDSDNVTSAIRLYLKAGMVERPAFSVWGRKMAP